MSKRSKKYLTFSLVVILTSLVGLWLALPSLLSPRIKSLIEEQGSKALDRPVVVKNLNISSIYPLQFMAESVQVDWPAQNLKLNVKAIVGRINLESPLWRIYRPKLKTQLDIIEPAIDFSLSPQASSTPLTEEKPQQTKTHGRFLSIDSSLRMKVDSASINVKMDSPQIPLQSIKLTQFNLELSRDSIVDLLKPMDFKTSGEAKIKSAFYSPTVPFSLRVDEFIGSPQYLSVKNFSGDIGGLTFKGRGAGDLVNSLHNWTLDAQIAEVSQLPTPPPILPGKNWKGSITSQIMFRQNKGDAPYFSAQIKVDHLSGDLDLNHQDQFKLKGPADLDVVASMVYYKRLSIPSAKIDGDFSRLEIEATDYFKKSNETPFFIKGSGSLRDGYAQFDDIDLRFDRFNAQAKGRINQFAQGNSDFTVNIPRTNLAGLEEQILPLRKFPLQGEIQLMAQIKGDVQNPEAMQLHLKPFDVRDIVAQFDYKDEKSGVEIKVPMRFTAKGQIVAHGRDLKEAQIVGDFDATTTAVKYGDTFSKAAGEPTRFQVTGRKEGNKISLRSGALQTPFGAIQIAGFVSNPQRPNLDLEFRYDKLDLEKAAKSLPMLAPFEFAGTIKGRNKLSGVFDFADGIAKSPLKFGGQIQAQIPKYHIKVEPAKQGKSDAPTEVAAVEVASQSPVPNWPLIQNTILSAAVKINEFSYGDLKAKDIKTNLLLAKGALSGGLNVGEIFAGRIILSEFKTQILNWPWVISYKGETQNLELQSMLGWMAPSLSKTAAGQMTTQIAGAMNYPYGASLLEKLEVKGELSSKNLLLNTMDFVKMAGEKLEKIPDLGQSKTLKATQTKATMGTSFGLKNGMMSFDKLSLKFQDTSEFSGSGTVGLDHRIELTGQLALAQPPVKGTIYDANKDASGRLILPIVVKGDYMNPELSFAAETVNRMFANTLEFETKKAKDKIGQQVQSALKAEGKKVEEQIKDQLKNKLNSLIK